MRFRITRADLFTAFKAVMIAALLAKLFYDSFIALPFLIPCMLPYIRQEMLSRKGESLALLALQFRDAIVSVTGSQKAGYSAENAFLAACTDMARMHGKQSMICKELNLIAKGLANNMVLEDLLRSLGERSGQADIREFADVFSAAKRSGGNLTQIMAETIDFIGQKLETEREIRVLIAGKRLESRLMEVIPLFIIMYVGLTNRGFFAPLYHNVPGICIMTAALIVYLVSYLMIERIVAIRI